MPLPRLNRAALRREALHAAGLRRAGLHVLRAAASWPVASQEQSRRNALVACTVLAQRRAELSDVEEYLARHAATAHRGGRLARVTEGTRDTA